MFRYASVSVISIFFIVVSGSAYAAQGLDIGLSDTFVQFKYSRRIMGGEYGRNDAFLGLLYNSEQETYMIETGLQIFDDAGSMTPGLQAGVGPKVYMGITDATSITDIDGYLAIALGGLLEYRMLQSNRLILHLRGFYAPGIVAWGTDSLWEVGARVAYEVVPAARAYVGYQRIEGGNNLGKKGNISKGPYIGLNMQF